MTTPATADATATRQLDPFAGRAPATAPRRPRLLSHLGRWGRARRWLPGSAVRVIDIGCASAYGSAAIAGAGSARRIVIGVERDPEHLARAREVHPWIPVLDGDATDLPMPDAVADAVTMLDIVEHLERPEAAIAEARRVARADGVLIVSVPHRGLLHRLDALNLYETVRRRRPHLPPLASPTTSGDHEHRHFTVTDLEDLLRPHFAIDRVARTGIGLQELVTLAMLALRARGKESSWLARILTPMHLIVYLVDDLVPLGPFAYHVIVRARPVAQSTRA